jgi:hypothetical protein
MTDPVGRTLHRLGERLPGGVSMPGSDGYGAATATWSKPVGCMPARRRPLPDAREQCSTQRSERSIPMNGIAKQAAFYRGYLTD